MPHFVALFAGLEQVKLEVAQCETTNTDFPEGNSATISVCREGTQQPPQHFLEQCQTTNTNFRRLPTVELAVFTKVNETQRASRYTARSESRSHF